MGGPGSGRKTGSGKKYRSGTLVTIGNKLNKKMGTRSKVFSPKSGKQTTSYGKFSHSSKKTSIKFNR